MEKMKSLDEVIEDRESLNQKVQAAFSKIPAEPWEKLNRRKNEFDVGIITGKSMTYAPISYQITGNLEWDNLIGNKLLRTPEGIYVYRGAKKVKNYVKVAGKGAWEGTDYYPSLDIAVFFARKVGGSQYKNVASADISAKQMIIFDANEIERISDTELVNLVYAINQYVNHSPFYKELFR
ncbi:MAG: hypothetical protein M1284_01315 [Candidatus Parvarchaeota archaeon]|jgi:hypothetical protein|nr:hypothetical protein [Candidatus Parvarchaeota archaeon]